MSEIRRLLDVVKVRVEIEDWGGALTTSAKLLRAIREEFIAARDKTAAAPSAHPDLSEPFAQEPVEQRDAMHRRLAWRSYAIVLSHHCAHPQDVIPRADNLLHAEEKRFGEI